MAAPLAWIPRLVSTSRSEPFAFQANSFQQVSLLLAARLRALQIAATRGFLATVTDAV